MTGGAGSGDRRSPRLVLVAAILAAVLVVVMVLHRSAPAPVLLAGSAPAGDARLSAVPQEVTLDFSGTTQLALAHVVVEDAHGATVSRGDAALDGARVRQPVNADGDGLYQVGYHVVAANGAESSGVLRFTVGPASAGGPVPPAPDATVGHVHATKDPLSLVLVLIDLVLVLVVLIAMFGRRRTSAGTGTYEEDRSRRN